MAILTLTWHTMHDAKVCPICAALEGYQWTFDTPANSALPTELIADGMIVWNIQQGSEAHGRHGNNCRCHLEPQFDLSDLIANAQRLLSEVQSATGVPAE